MRLEVLGSGGAVVTPRPLCDCPCCQAARAGKPGATRLGPSVFIHGPDLLVDPPEEIALQLNRSGITRVGLCLYSHWHPDHTAGRRVFEMNKDWMGLPPRHRSPTPVLLTQAIQQSFGRFLGLQSHLEFLAGEGLVELTVIPNDAAHRHGAYTLRPIQLAQDFAFGWEIEGEGKRILVVMDELKGWNPGPALLGAPYDLVYLPLGILDANPLSGQVLVDPAHPLLAAELSSTETLNLVSRFAASRFILSHIEEPDGISPELGHALSRRYSSISGKDIRLAWDQMVVEI